MTQHLIELPQLRLPGQAAAPPGPVSMHAMYIMHRAFRRDLDRFVEAASATPVTDQRTWDRLGRRWDFFARALHHHHAAEDAGLWPILEARATDDQHAVLAAMAAEHETIDPLLEACARRFASMADNATGHAREALVTTLTDTRTSLDAHLAHEETDAMPILQQHLSPADWHRIEREHFQRGVRPSDVLRAIPGPCTTSPSRPEGSHSPTPAEPLSASSGGSPDAASNAANGGPSDTPHDAARPSTAPRVNGDRS